MTKFGCLKVQTNIWRPFCFRSSHKSHIRIEREIVGNSAYMKFGRNLFLFDLILYVPSTIFQLNRDGSTWVELVLS